MGSNPFNKIGKNLNNAVKETTKAVNNAVNETTKAVNAGVNETTKAINVAGKTIVDTSGKLTKEAEDLAKNTVTSINKEVVSKSVQTYTNTTISAMSAAKVSGAAMNDIEVGAKLAGQLLEKGVETIEEGGELIKEWAEKTACQIGVSTALGKIFAALLYRLESSSVATTNAATAPLSGVAITYLAAKETVGAVSLGTACDLTAAAFVELIWISPDVQKAIGKKNKQILTDGIAFSLCVAMDKAAGAMVDPQTCAAVVAGVVTTLVAQIACERSLPKGSREWATVGASRLLGAGKKK